MLSLALQAIVLVSAIWIIKADGKSLREKIDTLMTKIIAIELSLRDCVKWSDLDRELDPIKADVKGHDTRITVMETKCQEQHK